MGASYFLSVVALFLASFTLKGCAQELEMVPLTCDLQETHTQSWCELPRNFESTAYDCSYTGLVNCNSTVFAAEESSCFQKDNRNVRFFCKSGKWTVSESGPSLKRDRRGSCLIFCYGGGGSAPQNKAPSISACPPAITQSAPPGKTEVKVTWTEPSASDPEQGSLTPQQTTGPKSGSVFPKGSTHVTYVVRDNQGLSDYCFFTVTVTVKECSAPPYLLHGTRTCTASNIYGSVCSHDCEAGYKISGTAQVVCLESETWSHSFTTCQPVSCGSLPTLDNGHVVCLRPPVYPEYCSIVCNKGFQHSGTYFTSCGQDATWSRVDPCKDVEAPQFPSGCPPNLQLFSGPKEAAVPVNWSDPDTTDNSGGVVTLTSLPARGTSLGPGFHLIRITATDVDGNSALCFFVVTIQAKKCQALSAPFNGRLTCTHGYVEGSECKVTCLSGYEVKGSATLQCLNTELWNGSVPTCDAVTCPNPPTIVNGSFSCSSGHQYQAVCSLVCGKGFVSQSHTFIQCLSSANWSAAGTCLDVEAPTFDNGCANNTEVKASRLRTPTLVQWQPPSVSDNSGGPVQLKSDIPSGSEFQLGVTWVTYDATDASNNRRSCRFSVTVTTLSCSAPNLQPPASNRTLMLYTCPDGHLYGASCTLACAYGYPLVGSNTITCELDSRTYPPNTFWQWPGPSANPPVCRESRCPDLEPPDNGALACSLGNFGYDCLMSCKSGWDVPSQTDGHLYCANSNQYWIPATAPDCVVRLRPGQVRVNSDVFYYANSCNMSETELKENFIQRMNASTWRDACINVCELQNIQVTCGPAGRRRKRDVDSVMEKLLYRERRQAEQLYVTIKFQIVMAYDEDSRKPEDMFQDLQTSLTNIHSILSSAADNGLLNFGDLTTYNDGPVGYPKLDVICPNGTFFRNRDNTKSYSCTGCGAGHYLPFDETQGVPSKQCKSCPVGSYTELDNATSCTPCPSGWSTLQAGSKNSSDCLELCTVGKMSSNGFVPCQPCPPGRYQSRDGATTCDLCPSGTWTEAIGATSIEQCIPADIHLTNSSLKADVSGQWSELTVTGWILPGKDSVTAVTLSVNTAGYGPVSLSVYNDNVSPTDIPANGTTSVSLNVPPEDWLRVLFVVDPASGKTDVYHRTSLVLSYTHTAFTGPKPASLVIDSNKGMMRVSGLHASNRKLTASEITTQSALCAGNSTDNILTWTPSPSSVYFPTECDALDECLEDPCGGHPCENRVGGFVCHCQDGWSGDTCSIPPDSCYNNHCQHGATCVSSADNYTCVCPVGYAGNLCNLEIVAGGWGAWSTWTDCTASCGGGQQTRQRLCNNPAPLNGGSNCTGDAMKTVACGELFCPVNGNWSAWGEWSECNATCGGGIRSRQRACDDPPPQHGGEVCEGVGKEEETCNTDLCPVHGGWDQWSEWTQCSVTCGNGQRSRDRTCTKPAPANGGDPCSGTLTETQRCSQPKCPECPPLVRPSGASMFITCEESSPPYLKTCNVTCRPGYVSVPAIPQYTCGVQTNYLWSNLQKDASSTTLLPDTCKIPTTASSVSLDVSVPVNTPCDGSTAEAIKYSVEQNIVGSVPCVQDNKCQTTTTTSCRSDGSSGRRRRSTGETLVVSVNMTANYGTNTPLTSSDTTTLQEYTDFIRLAEESAMLLIGNNTNNIYSVTVGDQTVTPDYAALLYTAVLSCPSGSGAIDGVCAECPAGYQEEKVNCVPCPFGQYQDQSGSTSCKPCPGGLTWDILGATSVDQCVYPITTTTDSPQSPTGHPPQEPEMEGDNSDNVEVKVAAVLGALAVTGIIATVAIAVYKWKVNTANKLPSLTKRASLASMSSMVHPEHCDPAQRAVSPSAIAMSATMISSPPPPYSPPPKGWL